MNGDETTIQLDNMDRILLAGISAREREMFQQFISPWQNDYNTVLRDIENRHNLPAGAIGTTHVLNRDDLTIVKNPEQPQQPPVTPTPIEPPAPVTPDVNP